MIFSLRKSNLNNDDEFDVDVNKDDICDASQQKVPYVGYVRYLAK